MARTVQKLEKEISRLEEIRARLAQDEADAAAELARLASEAVIAMSADDSEKSDAIEYQAQSADGRRTIALRRRDAVQQAIALAREELEAVRAGDRVKAAHRRYDGGETRFEAGRRDLHAAIRQASSALGVMHLAHNEAQQAADELVELGEERPGLYAYPVARAGMHLQQLRDEAIAQALIAAQATSPAFTWTLALGAAVPSAD